MAGPTLKAKECNFVDNDAIWISHCNNELKSSKIWNDKWGFLLEDYQKLEDKSRALDIPESSAQANDVMQQAEVIPVERAPAGVGHEQKNSEVPRLEIPKTTTGMSSWLLVSGKSPLIKVSKEKRRGKHDILNQLGWPLDGVN
ncbi:hypothetical protein LOD99_2763 [Oopsacas minuta]|uniref:Uncharacterized protein n=1 Tax=Oopsacas minuta TaxID=111878 RepID=A0AAV7K0V8_9METZ|nr:hypothetical protein LOD99_2763 [Oopsacas minuta]